MVALRWAVTIAIGCSGAWCIAASLPWWRRTSLVSRVDAALHPGGAARSGRWQWSTVRAGTAQALERFLPDGDLATRLAGAGRSPDAVAARSEQAVCALVGVAVGLGLDLLVLVTGRSLGPILGCALPGTAAVAGAMAWDRRLTRDVHRRRAEAAAEFPTVADLLCLSVTAGENLRGALEVVAASSPGPLGYEITGALRDARTGVPLAEALTVRAVSLGEPGFERFVRAVLAASERGVAVADALRSMAADARDGERVALVEAAGRKQVTMLVPVVALILPVALLFAFFPGVVAIRNLS